MRALAPQWWRRGPLTWPPNHARGEAYMLRTPFAQRIRMLALQDRLRYLRAEIDQYQAEVEHALVVVQASLQEPPACRPGSRARRPARLRRTGPLLDLAEYENGGAVEHDDADDGRWSRDGDAFPNGRQRYSSGREAQLSTGRRQRVLIQALDRLLTASNGSSHKSGLRAVNRQLATDEEPPADESELAEAFALWLSGADED